MHGAGNDYVFIDEFSTTTATNFSQLAIAVSNRNFGVGADGLVVISPSLSSSTDARMRMWNSDGSEGTMCGNALRCIALWLQLTNRATGVCRIGTASRVVDATTLRIDRARQSGEFSVNLGPPKVLSTIETLDSLPGLLLTNTEMTFKWLTVCMGNPHAVVFVDELSDRLVRRVGSSIETHPRFPGGTNVEWVRVVSDCEIEVRVWERGSGETLACGSGACAAAVAAISQGYCQRRKRIRVRMPGGDMEVDWMESCEVVLSGPAEVSFSGEWN